MNLPVFDNDYDYEDYKDALYKAMNNGVSLGFLTTEVLCELVEYIEFLETLEKN